MHPNCVPSDSPNVSISTAVNLPKRTVKVNNVACETGMGEQVPPGQQQVALHTTAEDGGGLGHIPQ